MAATEDIDRDELLRLLEISRRLAEPMELDALLTLIVDSARATLKVDRGSVLIYDPKKNELAARVATGVEVKELRFGADKGIAGETVKTRQVVHVPDCQTDPRFNREIDKKTGYVTRTLLSLPLISTDGQLVGVLQLLNPDGGNFNDRHIQLAGIIAAQAAVALQRNLLEQERDAKRRLEHDLNLARSIQMDLLPKKLPAVPGYDVVAATDPMDATGGDIYDIFGLDDAGRLCFFMADAAGHGIAAALAVTQARAMLRVGLRVGGGALDVLKLINRQVHEDTDGGRFITAFIGVLDPAAHVLDYHAAGQGPLLHYKAATDEFVSEGSTTLPIGVLDEIPPEDVGSKFVLSPGDWVILLTDGFYEYHGPTGDQMGEERIKAVIRAHAKGPAKAMLDALNAAITAFAGGQLVRDDMTAVLIKRNAG
jgi:phosphoserine phosphatase